jgi:phosphate transport system substrate-binding protein
MKTLYACIAVLLLISVSCKPSMEKTGSGQETAPELKGTLKISGAYALGPLMKLWADKFMVLNPGLKIEVVENGTGSGITDLLSGKSNIAMTSIDLSLEQEEKGLLKMVVSREGVIPIINSKNPQLAILMKKGITRKILSNLFSGEAAMSWGALAGTKDNSAIHIYSRADQSGAASIWAGYLELPLKELKGLAMEGDTGVIAAILKDPLGLSFCNAHYAFNPETGKQIDGLRVLPVDFNNSGLIDKKEDIYESITKLHRAAYLGTYPTHLCRELSLVSNGKPTDPNIVNFIKWILTDGQDVAVQAGYCEMRSCDKDDIINKLDEKGK